MCVYVFMCICVYVCIYMCVYMYVCVCVCVCVCGWVGGGGHSMPNQLALCHHGFQFG